MTRTLFIWVSISIAVAAAWLVFRGHYLYRPGFWDLWWLLTEFFRILLFAGLPGLLVALLLAFFPGYDTRFNAGLLAGAYLSCIGGLFGPWSVVVFFLGFVAGWFWPTKRLRHLLILHMVGLGFTFFVLAHAKALLEI